MSEKPLQDTMQKLIDAAFTADSPDQFHNLFLQIYKLMDDTELLHSSPLHMNDPSYAENIRNEYRLALTQEVFTKLIVRAAELNVDITELVAQLNVQLWLDSQGPFEI